MAEVVPAEETPVPVTAADIPAHPIEASQVPDHELKSANDTGLPSPVVNPKTGSKKKDAESEAATRREIERLKAEIDRIKQSPPDAHLDLVRFMKAKAAHDPLAGGCSGKNSPWVSHAAK
jgi:hypothetical protein